MKLLRLTDYETMHRYKRRKAYVKSQYIPDEQYENPFDKDGFVVWWMIGFILLGLAFEWFINKLLSPFR